MIDIGSQIKKYRLLAGLTQQELGERVDVTGAYIYQIEKGVKSNTSLKLIARIAKALRVELGELLDIFDTTFHKTPSQRLEGVPKDLLDAYVLEVIGDFMKERNNSEIHF
jgi:transcriptional regulator with XRE-family HTH domain